PAPTESSTLSLRAALPIERRGGKNAGLPHATAKEFSMPPGGLNQVFGSTQGGADRGSQAFAEADAHGVEVPGPAASFEAAGHHRIEQPRSVQMRGQSIF